MRVLHVYKTYPPVLGGIEGHLQLLSRAQVERGVKVTVLVTGRGPTRETVEDGVTVIRCRRLAELRSMPISLDLVRRLRRLRPDVTHLQSPFPLGELAHWLFGCSRATVVSYQSDIVRQRFLGRLYRPLLIRGLQRADRILVTSPRYLETSPVLRRVASRCRVVPLGVEVDAWSRPDPELVADFRRRWPGPLVVFVGRHRAYKGLEDLIAAAERTPGARFLLAGDGPMRRLVENAARRGGGAERIHFAGDLSRAELAACYAAADLLVLPSRLRSEAFGLVLVEAMAAGLPVISTEVGTGTSWVNVDGETGLVVPPADPAALAGAIARLLADPERRREMGRAARTRASARFSAETMVENVLDVYRQAVAGRPLSEAR